MTTGTQAVPAAEPPRALTSVPDPDTLPDPDGSNTLPVPRPPYAFEGPVAAEEPPEPPAPDPAPSAAETVILRPVAVPLAEPSDIMRWLAEAAAQVGEPASMALATSVREVQVNIPSHASWVEWLNWFRVSATATRVATDVLGQMAEGKTTLNGWVLIMRLAGPAAEELT